MIRLTKLFYLLIIALGITSCDLLQNQQPQQSLPAQGGLETVGDYQSALIGAYNGVQTLDGGTNAGQILFAGDIMTGDTFWTGSFPTYTQIANQAMVKNNGSIEDQWNGAYIAINDANIILNGIDSLKTSEDNQAAVDDIKGQALFIRSLQYYYLVQYFAKPWGATSDNSQLGVPLQLTPVTSQADFEKPSRSTVKEVYDQIIDDLQTAQSLITNKKPNRGTSDAAKGLLARIALIQQRWQDAADLSNQVIPDFMLNDDVTTYFCTELSSESIFEIQNTTQDVPDPANTAITAVYNQGSRDDIQITASYVSALDNIVTDQQKAKLDAAGLSAVDTRATELLTGTATPEDVDQAPNADNTTKYEDVVNAADNLPIMRLSEMILTRAEALAELNGVNQESIDLLNQIRTRALNVQNQDGNPGDESLIEYNTADFQSKQDLIDAILLERRVELSFEGMRKTDLQRRHLDVRGTAWDADNLVFPIPQSQIDANTNIQQNPGYGN